MAGVSVCPTARLGSSTIIDMCIVQGCTGCIRDLDIRPVTRSRSGGSSIMIVITTDGIIFDRSEGNWVINSSFGQKSAINIQTAIGRIPLDDLSGWNGKSYACVDSEPACGEDVCQSRHIAKSCILPQASSQSNTVLAIT